MTQTLLYSATGIALFGIGLYGLLIRAAILHKVLAVNIMSIGVFMVLVANASTPSGVSDPVPHAMVLTGIVVAVAGTALALSLIGQIHDLHQAPQMHTGKAPLHVKDKHS